jgi:AcrR family transcriptional regulator
MELFERAGYAGTTVADIADGAGVALQTVYNAVGSKAAVLGLVLDTAAAGDLSPTPVVTFMQQRTSAANSAGELVGLLADWFAEVHPRTSGMFRIIREAAAVDPEIAQLQARREQARLDNYQRAADALLERGAGGGAGPTEIAASIWSLGHPATYAMLVGQRGWTVSDYHNWLAHALHRVLATSPETVRTPPDES